MVFTAVRLPVKAQNDKEEFKNPPQAAHPRTWWHWTGSNISKEGITKDLEWMKRMGIAGMQLSDVASGGGQEVSPKLPFGAPEWLYAVHHAAKEAERLNLEMTMFSSAGWSLTGGPWVKPEGAMKKLVWSELNVNGGKLFNRILPHPPTEIGSFKNSGNKTGYYNDCAVIAFKTPNDELEIENNRPVISSNKGVIKADALLDDDLNSALTLGTAGEKVPVWIQFSYDKPFKAKALSIGSKQGIPFGSLMASTDGINYKILAEFPGKSGYRGSTVRTFSFPEITAKYFRIELTAAPFKPASVISQATTSADTSYSINELKLFSGARINRWEDKAGFNFLFEYESVATPKVKAEEAISQSEVINLTAKMSADGTLNWAVPNGKWTIMRFGYSLTGAKNRPAVPTGLGYEADKLSKKYTEDYLKGYTAPLMKELGNLYGNRLQYMIMDSWEAGIQNWTDELLQEFKNRRGYDLSPYLPALAGRVVQNAEVSDRVLWDFRRTLVDMFAENHYGTITDFLHKQGLKTYGEAGGVSLESMEDALLNKKYVDIPMGEFWVKDLHPSSMYYEDVRGAASAGHIYGKNIIAAESFTGGNYESPYTLKKISDYWFTQGINRLVFHTSAHQPLDTKPGNTMVGTHINRNITWAEKGAPFIDYLSRNAYMLQKGTFVADIAYLLNEGGPSTMPFWGAGLQPAKPEGYESDYVNADVVVNSMTVDPSGRIVLPSGMSYAVLVLPNVQTMTLPVLKKIKELVNDGATIVGPKPLSTPSLANYPNSDQELSHLANEVWGDLDGISRFRYSFGKGQVIWGMPLSYVMNSLKLIPDIEWSKPLDVNFSWIHKKDGDKDIYFVVNGSDFVQDLNVRFRVTGKEPELWHSGDGSTEPAAFQANTDRTLVPLHFEAREAMFVVFDKASKTLSRTLPLMSFQEALTMKGPWEIDFPEKGGAPAKITLDSLSSWTANTDEGIKYFSGTATYTKTFEASKEILNVGKPIFLDLGTVSDLAEVNLNGISLPILWKAPFRTEITKALKKGKNLLQIKVTNEWTNRLIGDQLHPDKKVLDSYTRPFGGAYQLTDSGLIGPVKIVIQNKQ
jgi:hypothetical protein